MDNIGLIPPHSTNIEECVLSALITFPEAYMDNEDMLDEGLFYKDKHKHIFEAIKHLFNTKSSIDMMTVANRLNTTKNIDKVGGFPGISKISMVVSSEYHLEGHIKILRQASIARDLIAYGKSITSKAFDPNVDVMDLLDEVQSNILAIGDTHSSTKSTLAYDIMKKEIDALNSPQEDKSWVSCHINKINKFSASQYIILAARPQHGKSALMLDIADRQATSGIPVAVFSLEMKDREKIYRIWQKHLRVHKDKIQEREIDSTKKAELGALVDNYKNIPLYIDTDPSLSISQFKTKARRLVKKYGVKVIYVDYIQLMTCEGAYSREREVSEISRGMKEIAIELDITIVALSQLNRAIEQRPLLEQFGKLSDLRDSGSLEQDANTVIFLTNFDVLGLKDIESYGNVEGKALLHVAKAREGGRGPELLVHSSDCMSWDTDMDSLSYEDEEPF